jgi:integrase
LLSLSAARRLAADAQDKLKQGVDPGAVKREGKEARTNTLRRVAEEYLTLEAKKLRSGDQRRKTFERLVYPVLGNRPIAEVRRSDVVKLLDKVEAEAAAARNAHQGGARAADECLAALSRLFAWYSVRDERFNSPIVRGMRRAKPAHERARTRVLTDDELRRVWHAAGEMAAPSGAFIRFLLLTCARRSEAAALRWAELEGLDWLLPAQRNKAKEPLLRPLSGAALSVLASVPRIDGAEFVFRPTLNFARLKREIDERSGVMGWTLHDLRRSGRSLMSRAGVNADHAERCLGHAIGGVRATYDRHEFYAEKKRAFAALAALVERIVDPRESVVPLRGRPSAVQ